jgi:hypothetical protein
LGVVEFWCGCSLSRSDTTIEIEGFGLGALKFSKETDSPGPLLVGLEEDRIMDGGFSACRGGVCCCMYLEISLSTSLSSRINKCSAVDRIDSETKASRIALGRNAIISSIQDTDSKFFCGRHKLDDWDVKFAKVKNVQ